MMEVEVYRELVVTDCRLQHCVMSPLTALWVTADTEQSDRFSLQVLGDIYCYKGSARSEKIRPKNRAARRAAILGEFSNEGRIPSKPKVRFYVGGAISDCTRGWHLKWGKSAKF